MKRLLIIVGGLILLLLVLAVVGLQALKSGAGKGKIEAALSSALGQPVVIGSMSVQLIPTPALDASGIRIGGADSTAAPGIALARLHVAPVLSSFLIPGRTPSIDHIELVGLVVSVRRDKAGHWLAPVPPAGGASKSGGPGVELHALRIRDGAIRVVDDSLRAAGGGPTVTTISDVAADLQAEGGTLKVPSFTGRLGGTVVSGSTEAGPKGITLHLSSESIEGADLPRLFALAGMRPFPGLAIEGKAPFEMTTSVAPDFSTFVVTGKAAIERVKMNTITLQSLQAPFKLAKGIFTLDPLTFTMYRGRQQGAVSIDLNQPEPVYTIRTTVDGLDVDQALSANTTMKNLLTGTGKLTGNVRGSGSTAPAIEKSLAGTLRFELVNGVVRNFPLLAAINKAIGITEGTTSDTKFQSFSGTAKIGGGKAQTDDLALRAGELSLVGAGTLGFDQSLTFKTLAIFSTAKSAELAGRVGLVKRLENARGEIQIPVTITGTATAPKTTVDVQSVAKKQVQDQLQKGLIKLFQKN